MVAKFSIREFQKSLTALVSNLLCTIEAECIGFDTGAAATTERRRRVAEAQNGYHYFVQTHFPHHVRHVDPSELHVYLFNRLPQIVASPKGKQDAMAAPVAMQNPPWSVSCLYCGASFGLSNAI